VDGFANWSFKENISFQSELFTDLDLSDYENQDMYCIGLNIPGPAYGALAWKSVMSYAVLDELQRNQKLMDNYDNMMFYRGGLFRIANQGIGPAAVHALNTLYFKIISQDDVTTIDVSARGKIEAILTYFTQYPFDRQDANAYSNLALLQTAWGKHKEALASADKGIALFSSELQQKHVTEMSGGGQFYPIIIKWELYLTKARVLVLLNQTEQAKEPLVSLIREARAMKFSGQELADAEGLLSSL
jgi:tetratricopeptide (TPR) repeat protein